MKTILLLEDDKILHEGIRYTLEKKGYRILSYFNIEECKKDIVSLPCDLIILDVNLPDGDGFSFCAWIHQHKKTPLLFLSARDLEEDILKGYELGACEYITKPFSMNILLKKLDVILHREQLPQLHIYQDDFLRIDFEKGIILAGTVSYALTPTEYRIVKMFLEHKGQLLTYANLLEVLWDDHGAYVDKHTLAVNINRLRKKIEDETHKYITNVYGLGYLWKA